MVEVTITQKEKDALEQIFSTLDTSKKDLSIIKLIFKKIKLFFLSFSIL